MIRPLPIYLMALCLLVACAPASTGGLEPQTLQVLAATPPDAPPGTCWHRQDTAPVVETVIEEVLVIPAQLHADGTVATPPVYRKERRKITRTEPRGPWFETPCAEVYTPEFTATLQRALAARGFYRGAISGQVNRPTQNAIRRFQTSTGIKSATLSLAAARHMGLIAVERSDG